MNATHLRVVLAFWALLTLPGCAGPRPSAPPDALVVPPAGWRESANPAAGIEHDWWRELGDPVLDELVDAALAHNVDIAIAMARVEEARAQLRFADAQHMPELVGIGSAFQQRAANAFGQGVTQNIEAAQLSLSYELDLSGRLADASAAARAALRANAAARDVVRLSVSGATASAYVRLRALDTSLTLVRDTLGAREESLQVTRRRAKAGYGSELELSQAEAEYHATVQLIPTAELAISRVEHALSVLLGENPRAIVRGAELDAIRVPAVPADLPSTLLTRRPDLVQAEQQLVAADRSLDVARDAFMPTIRLGASGGFVDADLFADPIRIFALGGSVLAPLFTGDRLDAQADAAAARRDQAAFAYRRAALTAFREVEDALAAAHRFEEQERAITAQRDALSRAYELARNRFRAGYAPYLEQLDAQRGLLNAELARVQSRADRLNAAIGLYLSLGGGWTEGEGGNIPTAAADTAPAD